MILTFDTETTNKWNFATGIKDDVEHPSQPWPVSCAIVLLDPNTFETIHEGERFVIPEDDWVMSPEAEKVHGLSLEWLRANGSDPFEVAEAFMGALEEAPIVAGHNVEFDMRVMTRFLTAFGAAPRGAKPFKDKRVLDTMKLSTNVCKIKNEKRGGYKWPTLGEMHAYFNNGAKLEGAHGALVDTRACAEGLRHLHNLGAIK